MSLDPRVLFGDLDLTDYPYAILMDDGDDGVAQNVYASLDTELRDGTIVTRTNTQNREVTRVVMVEGADLLEVADAAAALARECEKPLNTLTLDPGDGYAPSKVYETFTAQLAEVALPGGDAANVRLYRVTWPALPFARSADPFTVTGVTSSVTPSTVTLSDGSTATGWSSSAGSSVTSDGSKVSMPIGFDANGSYPSSWVSAQERLRLAGAFDMSSTTFLQADVAAGPFSGSGGGFLYEVPGVVAFGDGVQLSRISASASPFAGFVRYTFSCPDTTVTEFAFAYAAQIDGSTFAPTGPLSITNVARTNVAPSVGTLRQKATTVEVPGSARTPASLVVSHASSGLGHVLVYTGPELGKGYSPALSPFRAAGATTDATTVSGSYTTGADTFDVPATSLPSGQYQLVARTRATAASATAQLRIGSTNVGLAQSPGDGAVMGAADADSYYLMALGSFFLPPHEVGDNSSAVVRVSVTAAASRIDEVWAFYLPDDNSAALSYVPVGTARRLWLNAATVNRPYPSALVGTASDGADAYGADGSTSNWSEHQFPAGEDSVFVVTTSALDAQVSVTGYARWHTHPAA